MFKKIGQVIVVAVLAFTVARLAAKPRRAVDSEPRLPETVAYSYGHTLVAGVEAEVLAFFDTGCDNCGQVLQRFVQMASSGERGVRYAVVSYARDPAGAARTRALMVECAAVEEAAPRALQRLFVENATGAPRQFAQDLQLRNVGDFVQCVETARFEYAIVYAAEKAKQHGESPWTVRVRAADETRKATLERRLRKFGL